MKYADFVDLGYEPTKTDLLCTFRLRTRGASMEEAAGSIAAESSIGTWTDITTVKPYVLKLAAHVFRIDGNIAEIAYPIELFEKNNMPNILSSIAGNVFGLKALETLRLEDLTLPCQLVKGFEGPRFGIEGIRKLFGIFNRPLIGTIIKPKLGLRTADHAKVAYEAWTGGCDIVKDDENLSGQSFNPFRKRVIQTLMCRDEAEKKTGEKKVYMANITAETGEMIRRAKIVKRLGGEYIMVDILTCGFSALQTLLSQDLELVVHAHRAGHAAFTKNRDHGISMNVIAKIARTIGVDQLHIGAVVGKMSETEDEVASNLGALKSEMCGLKSVMPIASGGLHPRLIPAVMTFFGQDVIIQAGGGIHGHSEGTAAGAKAMRQAVDAVIDAVDLDKYARSHAELASALKIWPARS